MKPVIFDELTEEGGEVFVELDPSSAVDMHIKQVVGHSFHWKGNTWFLRRIVEHPAMGDNVYRLVFRAPTLSDL